MASKVSGLIEKIQTGGSSGTTHAIASTAYGYCETAAGTAIKNVDMTGFVLVEGVTIHVKFVNANSADNPKLKFNGEADENAKPIVQYGTTAAGKTSETNGWYAGAVISLTYDGTSWVRDQGFNTNSQNNLVNQGTSTTASWRKVILSGGTSYTDATTAVSDRTDVVYQAVGIAAQPSTGTLQATSLKSGYITIGGSGDPASKRISSSSTLYLNRAISSSMIFQENGTSVMRIDTDNFFRPETNNTLQIGSSSYKWNAMYATTFYGALSGNATSATKATNDSDDNAINTTYLKKSGGKMTGPLSWTDNTALPQATSLSYVLGIDAFADGGTTKWISVANLTTSLGLSNALHFIGITSTTLSDGSTTSTLVAKSTNSLSKTTGFVNGDVVMDGDQLREYVWSGNAWRLLGITTSTAYSQTATGNSWITSITQGTDGKITATIGTLDTSGTWSGNATTASGVKDYNNNTVTTFGYSTSGMTSTSWLGSWDGYKLRAISPANAVKSGVGTTAIGNAEKPIYWSGSAFTTGNGYNVGGNLIAHEYLSASGATLDSYDPLTRTYTLTMVSSTGGRAGLVIENNKVFIPWGYYFILSCEIWSSVDATWNYDENTAIESGVTGNHSSNDWYNNHTGSGTAITANTWTKVWFRHSNLDETKNPNHGGIWEYSVFGISRTADTVSKQFKIRNVMGYYGTDTGAYYSISPSYAITNISRSGTTFTATRLDGSTFTFTQQDNNSVTGVKGDSETNYRTGNVNITKANIGLGNVENTKLSTWAGTANITTVGTIATGTWNGSTIGIGYGGTGATTRLAAGLTYGWTAIVKGQTWSRICYVPYSVQTTGSSILLNISGTRANVVYNYTLLINTHHSKRCYINAIQSSQYVPIAIRGVTSSNGDVYIELKDTAASISSDTTQTFTCNMWIITKGSTEPTLYTEFTTGETLPSNYTASELSLVAKGGFQTNGQFTGSGAGLTGVPTTSLTNVVSTTAKKFLKDTGAWTQVDWGDLTGKPSTFTPASHTHTSILPRYSIAKGTTPAEKTWCMAIQGLETGTGTAQSNRLYCIQGFIDIDGSSHLCLDAYQNTSGTSQINRLDIIRNTDGTNAYAVTDAAAFRTAISAWARPSSITADQILVSSGTDGTTTLRGIYTLSALGNSGWNTSANRTKIPDMNFIAYWNGTYDGSHSNLGYYSGGAFGTMAKETAADYAKLASPAFTGTPTAPTATNGTSTTQIATTEFVRNTLSYVNAMQFKGTLGTGGTVATLPDTHEAGDTYRVITAGTWAGKYCEVGTLIICVKDGTAAADADWTSVETNEDGAVIGPAGTNSSTDNAIVRWDGTSGRIIQNSNVTIDDNNNMTIPGTALKITNTSGEKYILIGNQDSSGTNTPVILKAANGALFIGNGTDWSSNTGGTLNTAIYMSSDRKIGIGTTSPSYTLSVNGEIGAAALRLKTAASDPSLSAGARIEFAYPDGQPVVLSYTPNDSYRAPAGLKVMGGTSATPAWFEVEGGIYTNSYYHIDANRIDNGSWLTGATGKAPTATTTDGTTTYSGAVIGTSILTLGNNKIGGNSASGVNNNAQGYLRIYSSGSAYAQITAYSGDKTRLYPEEGISIPTDKVGIMFRPTSGSYYTHFSYQTGNNEALVMATQNAVTSFIFINGESYANVSNTRWRSLTPALQIKNNSVIIGKLIDTGVTPSYKFEVNGTTYINGATIINSTTQINNTLTLYCEGTTSANSPARITFTVKDTDKDTSNTGYIAYYHDHTTTYNGNLVINSNGGTFIGAGESASTLYTALGSTSSTENLYLTADNVLYAYAYADTAANRIGFAINTSGHIVPQKAEGKNNNAQNLGASDNRWANIYVTTVTSIAASLTSATSTTANTIANATLTLGNNANVNSTTAHSEGEIVLYSAATAAHTIKGASTTTAYTHTLPNNTGLLVSLSGGTAKGSSTKPIYIPATGIVTECSTYAGGTKVTLNNSDKGASSAAFYAPTSGGTAGQPLIGAGTTTEPAWYGGLTLSGSAAATWVASFAGTTASTTTTSGAVKVAGGLGVAGQVTALRLAANGSNTNYSLYVNGASYLQGATTINGDLYFNYTGTTTNGYITWNSGSWYQRIQIDDNSDSNNAVFTFQQSSDSGSTYTNLFTILDNKSVATDRYNYTVSDVIKAYTQYNATDDSIDFIFA